MSTDLSLSQQPVKAASCWHWSIHSLIINAWIRLFGMLGLINAPPPDTRTRGCTATGSRVGQDRASTAPSGPSRAGRRPERPEPPPAAATSYLQERHRKWHHQCVFFVLFSHNAWRISEVVTEHKLNTSSVLLMLNVQDFFFLLGFKKLMSFWNNATI